MLNFRYLSVSLLFFAFLLIAWKGFSHDPYALDSPVDGLHLTNLHHKTTHNQLLRYSDFSGKWVYVEVWASWCPSCQAHWNDHLETHGVERLGLAMKDSHAAEWLRDHPMNITQIIRNNEQLLFDLGVVSAPESFLIDPTGHVAYRWYGPVTQQAYDEVVLAYVH